eukprot:3094394-Amphidinium_carterae.1
MEHSKVCRKGTATWNVRCEDAPPAYAYPLSFGHQRVTTLKVLRAAKERVRTTTAARHETADGLKSQLGQTMARPKRPAKKLRHAQITESDRESAGAQGADDMSDGDDDDGELI